MSKVPLHIVQMYRSQVSIFTDEYIDNILERALVIPPNFVLSSYRGTSLITKRLPLGPYRRPVPRA